MREAKVVQWLAEAGVDLNCTDQFGNSSLMLAIERRPETPRVSPLARLKRRMKGKTTSPEQINLERMFETVQVLVRHGADIERANRDGITPLQMHLNNALPDLIHLGMVTFLVEHGANLKARVVPIGEDPQHTTKIQQVIQDAWGHRKDTILSGLNGNLPSSDLKKLVLEYEKLSTDSVSESILDSL
jgi:ankyrin repeat protein